MDKKQYETTNMAGNLIQVGVRGLAMYLPSRAVRELGLVKGQQVRFVISGQKLIGIIHAKERKGI